MADGGSANKVFRAGDTVSYRGEFYSVYSYTEDHMEVVIFSRKNGWDTVDPSQVSLAD